MSKRLLILLTIGLLVLAGCSKKEQVEVTEVMTEDVVDSLSIEEEETPTEDKSSQEEPSEEESMEEEASEEVMEDQSEEPAPEAEQTEEVSEEPQEEAPSEEPVTLSSASYVAYTEGAEATMAGKQKAIFFHAKWCSTCRALDGEINSRLSELPGDTVVFKADFDSDTTLRQKYGVQLQHTVVFVDDSGNETSRLTGANFEALMAAL